MERPTLIVLAGGKGTRLASLYPDLPKPLVPMAGKPFLHWLVTWFVRQGCKDFVFSIGHKGEKIHEWLRSSSLMEALRWQVFHEKEPLGTGGGARACLDLCGENVLVTNGDSLILCSLDPLWDAAADLSLDGILIGAPLKDASRFGTLALDEDGFLTGFHEKRPGEGLINAGLYFFRRRALESLPLGKNLSMEYDVIPSLIASDARLKVLRAEEKAPFIDIGTPETVRQGESFVRQHLLGETA